MALGDLARAMLAGWEAVTHHDVTPTPAVIAGGVLKAAGGSAKLARAKLAAIDSYLKDVEDEEAERARRSA